MLLLLAIWSWWGDIIYSRYVGARWADSLDHSNIPRCSLFVGVKRGEMMVELVLRILRVEGGGAGIAMRVGFGLVMRFGMHCLPKRIITVDVYVAGDARGQWYAGLI